ncbi:hypothetical protein ACI6Q2_04180 [Chitinophagaceae bacterium LWZ2-11]
MNFLRKILSLENKARTLEVSTESQERITAIQNSVEELWKLPEETLGYYTAIACQCAFPRFRQYAGISCTDTRNVFMVSETEGFIHHAEKYFDKQAVAADQENYKAIYTCKKCGSVYDFAYSEFSIAISRTVLKIRELKASQIGADIETVLLFNVGLFGYSYPSRDLFKLVDLETFATYIREVKG